MGAETAAKLDRLRAVIDGMSPVAVAVSGGVDSMTLAAVAHGQAGAAAEMFHATSPAVPPEATARVRAHAAAAGWKLQVINAGEFDDPDYLRNPHNRCFYCKTNLYDTIVGRTAAQVVSGANLDDLGDYRPGLQAAADHDVRHPYLEAEIDKPGVRAIAAHLGLDDLADLPAAPCLSSRVETGLRIEPDTLALIHAIESYVQRKLRPAAVRCRVRHGGIVVELDTATFEAALPIQHSVLTDTIGAMLAREGRDPQVGFEAYRRGSAFLKPDEDGRATR